MSEWYLIQKMVHSEHKQTKQKKKPKQKQKNVIVVVDGCLDFRVSCVEKYVLKRGSLLLAAIGSHCFYPGFHVFGLRVIFVEVVSL